MLMLLYNHLTSHPVIASLEPSMSLLLIIPGPISNVIWLQKSPQLLSQAQLSPLPCLSCHEEMII